MKCSSDSIIHYIYAYTQYTNSKFDKKIKPQLALSVFRCQTPGPLRFYIVTLSTGFGTMPMAVDKETFEEKHLAPGTTLVVDGTIVAEMLELSAQNE